MLLTRHATSEGSRWAVDGHWLDVDLTLGALLQRDATELESWLTSVARQEPASGDLLAPVDADSEVWASGVTYLRSRQAREAESHSANVYERVYDAARPELFFKAVGWRAIGHGGRVRVRPDSAWNVPEPELTLVVNAHGDVVGYCAGNDLSSRDIEGENPLYLPQAKVFDGSCAIGPGIVLCGVEALTDVPITLRISRAGQTVFAGETRSSRMKRSLGELVEYLRRDLSFPRGVLLMTGTGIVPEEDFSLTAGDTVRIGVGEVVLENVVG